MRHLPYGGVDWNFIYVPESVFAVVTSHTEVWIETGELKYNIKSGYVTSHTEVWIETHPRPAAFRPFFQVTSHTEVWIETDILAIFSAIHIVTSHTEVWIETDL